MNRGANAHRLNLLYFVSWHWMVSLYFEILFLNLYFKVMAPYLLALIDVGMDV